MPDIRTQLQVAICDEPPLGFAAADIITTARRARRRKRNGYATVAVGAAAAVAVVLTLSGGRPADHHAEALSLAALTRTAAIRPANATAVPSRSVNAAGTSAAEVIMLAEKDTGIKLTAVQASVLRPPGELDLAAALAVPGRPYLNIQVIPSRTLSTAMPTCAVLSDASSGTGDGFYGPCTIHRLGDGSILIERSGRSTSGGYTMAQATLIRADGSGVFAEDTNQAAAVTGRHLFSRGKNGAGDKSASPPAVRPQPAVGASTLATLVRDIAAKSRP